MQVGHLVHFTQVIPPRTQNYSTYGICHSSCTSQQVQKDDVMWNSFIGYCYTVTCWWDTCLWKFFTYTSSWWVIEGSMYIDSTVVLISIILYWFKLIIYVCTNCIGTGLELSVLRENSSLGDNCFDETQLVERNFNYDFNYQQFVHWSVHYAVIINNEYTLFKVYIRNTHRVILYYWSDLQQLGGIIIANHQREASFILQNKIKCNCF